MTWPWIVFWALEGISALVLLVTWRANRRPTSMDVAMGDEIGMLLIGVLMAALGFVGLVIWLIHHMRFA